MTRRRTTRRRRGGGVAAAVFLALFAVLATSAPGSADPGVREPDPARATADSAAVRLAADTGISTAEAEQRLVAERAAAALGTSLIDRLGDTRTGGAYLEDGRLVVAVTDARTADEVRTAGATPRSVTRSTADLTSASEALDRAPDVVGASWGIDPTSNQVVLSVPAAASGTAVDALVAEAGRRGPAVRVERVAGGVTPTNDIAGGDPIRNESNLASYCSAGFNVTYQGVPYVLTAGHCLAGANRWINWHGGFLGTNHVYSFPTYDDGLIRITEPIMQIRGVYTWNGQFQSINSAGESYVGQWVCKSGSTTGLTCGTVQLTDVTVQYPQGAVIDLNEFNGCVEGGDSGGSVYSGDVAQGLVSGAWMSNGRCLSTPKSYYQPILSSLGAYQVQLA